MPRQVAITTANSNTPVGKMPGGHKFELMSGATVVETMTGDEAGVTFAEPAPGTYTVRVTARDTNGGDLGTPTSSQPFTVNPPPFKQPTSVVVSAV